MFSSASGIRTDNVPVHSPTRYPLSHPCSPSRGKEGGRPRLKNRDKHKAHISLQIATECTDLQSLPARTAHTAAGSLLELWPPSADLRKQHLRSYRGRDDDDDDDVEIRRKPTTETQCATLTLGVARVLYAPWRRHGWTYQGFSILHPKVKGNNPAVALCEGSHPATGKPITRDIVSGAHKKEWLDFQRRDLG